MIFHKAILEVSLNYFTGSVGRFEKLEREVLSLHRKLEKESQMRKQLAEKLIDAGIKLPSDLMADK